MSTGFVQARESVWMAGAAKCCVRIYNLLLRVESILPRPRTGGEVGLEGGSKC
jgi:hypothetical protein